MFFVQIQLMLIIIQIHVNLVKYKTVVIVLINNIIALRVITLHFYIIFKMDHYNVFLVPKVNKLFIIKFLKK